MHKSGSDPKVKKTLVRNCERKVRPTGRKLVIHDTGSKDTKDSGGSSTKENELNKPTLCSSEVLAHYLSDMKISAPPSLTTEDLNVNKSQICAKVTKKLNFQFNDRIYKNLIELNANVEESKKKKDRRHSSCSSIKRDLEPNMEDFYEDVKDKDSPPNIPALKLKFKPVKNVENGDLHKLVAALENL